MTTVNTKPTLEGYKFYYRPSTFKRLNFIVDIVIMVLMVAFGLFSLYYYLSRGKGFGVLVLYTFVIAIDAMSMSKALNTYKEKYEGIAKLYPDLTEKIVFEKDDFIYEEKAQGHSTHFVFDYRLVKRARYSKGWFAVYLKNGSGCVFSERDINGDPDEIKILLRGSLGKRFHGHI